MFQAMAEQEIKLKQIEQSQTDLSMAVQVAEHRINNLDGTNIEGTPRQKLNQMIRLYAFKKGVTHQMAWHEFRAAFDRAYRTNIETRCNNYCIKNGIKKLSMPEYLEKVGLSEDAVRVADKLLNEAS